LTRFFKEPEDAAAREQNRQHQQQANAECQNVGDSFEK